jgi:hypothetical protein
VSTPSQQPRIPFAQDSHGENEQDVVTDLCGRSARLFEAPLPCSSTCWK